ncbi:hypothetical protein ACIQOV_18030 [Kitasatospora sp. NPDC091257]|uniref:hypothetical protein n=1 Tax=Kitasatospora sp. NPDC091257 TaxID=3364084 RepID=UPI0037F7D7F5
MWHPLVCPALPQALLSALAGGVGGFGQRVGGAWAASKNVVKASRQCHCIGKRIVRRHAERAIRAGILTRWARRVAVGALAWKFPEGRWAGAPDLPSAITCSTTVCCQVLELGLERGEGAVGEDGAVAPGCEQLALTGGGFSAQPGDAAHDEEGGDLLGFPT